MALNRNNISKKFQTETYRRFTRKSGGQVTPRKSRYDFTPDRNGTPPPSRNSKYDFTRKSGSTKFDPANMPNKSLPRDKPTVKYPNPNDYPEGSKYGPNRPMPPRKESYSATPRNSRYNFTTKSGDKTISGDTLRRKLNRRRNGS